MVWVSVVRSSRRLERHHGWRCRGQNSVTGVGNAPRPLHRPLSACFISSEWGRHQACRPAPLTSVNVVPAPWNHSDRREGSWRPSRRLVRVCTRLAVSSPSWCWNIGTGRGTRPQRQLEGFHFCETMLLRKGVIFQSTRGTAGRIDDCLRLPGRSWEIVNLSI